MEIEGHKQWHWTNCHFLTEYLEYSIGDYKISAPFNNYVMKTILSDAESREEHGETKYSLTGPTMAELWTFLCLNVGEIMEKE